MQRFGGSLNLNVHLHTAALDGVYTRSSLMAQPVFHEVSAPSPLEIEELSEWITDRVKGLLRRRGLFTSQGEWVGGEGEEPTAFDLLMQAAARDPGPGVSSMIARAGPRRTCFRRLAGAPAWRRPLASPSMQTCRPLSLESILDATTGGGTPVSWSALLRRVYSADVLACSTPGCTGRMRVISQITSPPVIRRILEHLGLPTEVPAFAPARGPPHADLDFPD